MTEQEYNDPYINYLQYRHYPEMSYADIQGYLNDPIVQGRADAHMKQTFPQMDDEYRKNYFAQINSARQMQDATFKANKQAGTLAGEQRKTTEIQLQNQQAQGANQMVDTAASSIPVYGQLYAGAKAASGTARGFIEKDERGEPTGKNAKTMKFVDDALTPGHEIFLNDLSKKKYGDAALDALTGSGYTLIKDLFA